jgi:transposase
MDYCGLDLGRTSSRICIVDKERNILHERDVGMREASLRRAFDRERLEIVLEASTSSFWVADLLCEIGHTVHVVDPNRTKAIGAALIKNDKLDARWLAYLAAAGLLATVRVPTQCERVARMPATARDSLVRCRTRLLNAVRSMAASEGIHLPKCGPGKLVELVEERRDSFAPGMFQAMQPMLEGIVGLSASIDASKQQLLARADNDPVLQRLQTVPGVGPVTATIFAAAIGDPKRFRSGRDVGAYLGLVPRLYQSGATYRRGGITKRGNRQARWALTMAGNAVLLCRSSSPLVDWAQRMHKRLGRKKACVAIARKLASILWAVWVKEQDFSASRAH